jgi:hypothetical protein
MRLLLLEGADSIGGTKIYLEDRGVGVLLDFGINFAGWGLFFEEFLRPRAGRGFDEEWTTALAADGKPRMIAATYADVLRQHREGTEYKYIAHNGQPATLRCGLLRRRPVFIERSVPIGKESRLAEEAHAGAVSAEAMDTFYGTPSPPGAEERTSALRELQVLLPFLKPVSRRWLAEHAQISNSSGMIRAILSGRKQPGTALARRLVEIAHAVQQGNGDLEQADALLKGRVQ